MNQPYVLILIQKIIIITELEQTTKGETSISEQEIDTASVLLNITAPKQSLNNN